MTDLLPQELRLADYEVRTPSSSKIPFSGFNSFAGLGIDHISEEASKRYDYLWQKCSESEELTECRKVLHFAFENSALVYVPAKCAWVPPSQCVWADSSVKISAKVSVADLYPSKKTFFTEVLQISEPTVDMYVDSLKAEAKGDPSAAQIEATMKLICGLGFEEGVGSSLTDVRFLPVRVPDTDHSVTTSFQSTLEDFAVLDNTIHQEAFRGKLATLDFTLEEIRDTRPLLTAMGLANKFSSKLVEEVTDVNESQLDAERTKIFCAKSQAIVRYVVHRASSLATSILIDV